MKIRRAGAEDGIAVARMVLASRRAYLPYLPQVHPDDDVERWITGLLGRATAWIAEREDFPIGIAVVDAGFLDQLYLSPGETGQGLGLALLNRAKEASRGGLKLYVFQRNEGARRFYEREGFVVISASDGSENEEREPDLLLQWHPA